MNTRNTNRLHRAARIRARVSGTATCPRLVVFRSLTTFTAQVIDDTKGTTLLAGSLADVKDAKNTVEGIEAFGKEFGKKCATQKIAEVVFDRAGYKYHGKVKAFADAVREQGVKF